MHQYAPVRTNMHQFTPICTNMQCFKPRPLQMDNQDFQILTLLEQ